MPGHEKMSLIAYIDGKDPNQPANPCKMLRPKPLPSALRSIGYCRIYPWGGGGRVGGKSPAYICILVFSKSAWPRENMPLRAYVDSKDPDQTAHAQSDQVICFPRRNRNIGYWWIYCCIANPISDCTASCLSGALLFIHEPPRGKMYLRSCAPKEDSNQPAQPRSLIKVFVVRMRKLNLRPWLSKKRPVKILIRLRKCEGWSESS